MQCDFPPELPSSVTCFKWSGQSNRRAGSVETWPLSMVLSLGPCYLGCIEHTLDSVVPGLCHLVLEAPTAKFPPLQSAFVKQVVQPAFTFPSLAAHVLDLHDLSQEVTYFKPEITCEVCTICPVTQHNLS